MPIQPGDPKVTPFAPERRWSKRDPEDRLIPDDDKKSIRDKMMDKTLADSFPNSDPPSSIPNPDDDSFAA